MVSSSAVSTAMTGNTFSTNTSTIPSTSTPSKPTTTTPSSAKPAIKVAMSYADHAKKAQHIKPSTAAPATVHSNLNISPSLQQSAVTSTATTTTTTTTTSASVSTSTSSTTPAVSSSTTSTSTTNSSASKPSSSHSASTDVTPGSSVILTRPQTRPPSPSAKSSSPSSSSLSHLPPSSSLPQQTQMTTGTVSDNAMNGVAATGSGSAAVLPPPTKQPVVNVWSLRQAQAQAQAQARLQQQQPSASSSSQTHPQGQVSGQQNAARSSLSQANKSTLPISRNTSSADDTVSTMTNMTSTRPTRSSPSDSVNVNKSSWPPAQHLHHNATTINTATTTINVNGVPANEKVDEEEEPDPFVPSFSSVSASASASVSLPAPSSSSRAGSGKQPPLAPAPPSTSTPQSQPQQKSRKQDKGAQAQQQQQQQQQSAVVQPVLPPAMDDVESWPEVGKSLSASVAGSENGKDKEREKEKEADTGAGMSGSNGGGKKKAAKWLPIPPEELQAAADAANSSRPRGGNSRHHSNKQGESRHHHGQGQGQGPRRTNSRSGSASASGSTQGNGGQGSGGGAGSGGGQSRIHSGRNSTVQSVAPSTSSHSRAQSRTESLQNSPKLGGGGGKGRRLPVDDVAFQGMVKPGSPVRYTPPPVPLPAGAASAPYPGSYPISVSASTSSSGVGSGVAFPITGMGAVPGPPDGSTYYLPHVPPHHYHQASHPPHPQSHPHTNSNPNSHSNTHTHSPMMTGQYSTLPGLNGFPSAGGGVGTSQGPQHQFTISVQGQRSGAGAGTTPPYGVYHQQQPQAQVYGTFDYVHGHPQGQPYPAYWSDHERQNQLSQLPHHQGSSAPGVVSSSSSSSSSYQPSLTQFGGVVAVPRMQQPPSQPLQMSMSQQASLRGHQQPHHQLPAAQQQLLTFGQVEGDVPSIPMQLPPPGESELVIGYRGVDPVDPDERRAQIQASILEGPGRTVGGVVFGSIGLLDSDQSPSPMTRPASEIPGVEGSIVGVASGPNNSKEGTEEKPFPTFSIGVTPGEPDLLRMQSRTRSIKARVRSEGQTMLDVANGQVGGSGGDGIEGLGTNKEANATEAQVIDLTDPDTKWEFGTTKHPEVEDVAPSQQHQPQFKPDVPPLPAVGEDSNTGYLPPQEQTVGLASPHLQVGLLPVTAAPNGLQMETPMPLQTPGPSLSRSDANDWEVKDFGYGFGRDKERERNPGRPRRGSYSGGYNIYEQRGRRGRAYGARGGYNMRGYNRGGYQNQQRQPPPFTVTPSLTQYQPSLPSPSDHTSAYYQHPPPPPIANYLPSYEAYLPSPSIQPTPPIPQGAPVPVPISRFSYPLERTSWYLLGQLEYYLSPQNMAQDYFLRQRMDSRGWIPISLIASFNRVKALTMDIGVVKSVLCLSSIAEVKDDWVRMSGNQWERYVLPDAPPSTVEPVEPDRELAPIQANEAPRSEGDAEHHDVEGHHDVDGEIDDEDEDDVVFVMN